MLEETKCLYDTASCTTSFHDPAVEAVHGDLNEKNVLITSNNWFVIDWDDPVLGDPAVDFAVPFWPMVLEGSSLAALLPIGH
jgi:aminoglycoside phosphotransferase (APT) family kinase protein